VLAPLEVAAVCRGHTDAVESLAASPAGDLCASGSWDATLRVWRTGGALASRDTSQRDVAAVKKMWRWADLAFALSCE